MTAARLALGLLRLLRPIVALGVLALVAVPVTVLALVAAHRCARPFPPDPVLMPLGAALEPSR